MENKKIPSYANASNVLFPSMTISMVNWMSYLGRRNFIVYDPAAAENHNDQGHCKYCNGDEEIETDRGWARCICAVKAHEAILRARQALYQDYVEPVHMEDFREWGEPQAIATIQSIKSRLQEWILWPDRWITMIGAYGSGKSTLLQILANAFGPWALYVTMESFEKKAFQYKEAGTLTVFEDHLSFHPILILDDPGSEYAMQGKVFVRSVMRSIIKARYTMWQERPVVVATNHGAAQLREYDGLIADRILDKEKVIIISMDGVPSYRKEASRYADTNIPRPR